MADLNKAKRNPFLKSGKKEEKNTNKTDTPLQHKLARHKVLMIYRICFVVALGCVCWSAHIYTGRICNTRIMK